MLDESALKFTERVEITAYHKFAVIYVMPLTDASIKTKWHNTLGCTEGKYSGTSTQTTSP
jgi:hypothetical protein